MNRQDFQALARVRLEEAKALLDAGRPAGAYYLAVRDYYSHGPADLRKAAGLDAGLQVDAPQGSDPDRSWGIVLLWKSNSRYRMIALQDAQDLYNAISDPTGGVLAWLQQNW